MTFGLVLFNIFFIQISSTIFIQKTSPEVNFKPLLLRVLREIN